MQTLTRTRASGSIGQVLKRLRREQRLKQEALAAASGLSQPVISRIETGLQLPDDYQRGQLAKALGCTECELI